MIAFLGVVLNVSAQDGFIHNGGFEMWQNQGTYTEPAGWGTLNSLSMFGLEESTTQTTDAHTGSFAAYLESKDGFVGIPGLLSSANIVDESGMPDLAKALVPFSSRPKYMSFYYKYFPATNDSFTAVMILTRWNEAQQKTDTVGVALFMGRDTVDTYTLAAPEFVYLSPLTPDSVMVIFSSSADGFNPTPGSKLYIDDFSFGFETGISSIHQQQLDVKLFPVPALSDVTIETDVQSFSYRVVGLDGKEYLNGFSSQSKKQISVQGLTKGIYVLHIQHQQGIATKRLVIQ